MTESTNRCNCNFIPTYLLESIAESYEREKEDLENSGRDISICGLTPAHFLQLFQLQKRSINFIENSAESSESTLHNIEQESLIDHQSFNNIFRLWDGFEGSESALLTTEQLLLDSSQENYDRLDTIHTKKWVIHFDQSSITLPPDSPETVRKCFEHMKLVEEIFQKIFQKYKLSAGKIVEAVVLCPYLHRCQWNVRLRKIEVGFTDKRMLKYSMMEGLDCIAHEMGHAALQRLFEQKNIAPLNYKRETGILEEHLADVFAIIIKQYNQFKDKRNLTFEQYQLEADWTIGNSILSYINGNAGHLRSMKEPGTAFTRHKYGLHKLEDLPQEFQHAEKGTPKFHIREKLIKGDDPQPDSMEGYEPFRSLCPYDKGGVHIYSGILNRAFYLSSIYMKDFSWQAPATIWIRTISEKLNPQQLNSLIKFEKESEFLEYQKRAELVFKSFAKGTIEIAESENSNLKEAVINAWKEVKVLNDSDLKIKFDDFSNFNDQTQRIGENTNRNLTSIEPERSREEYKKPSYVYIKNAAIATALVLTISAVAINYFMYRK